MAPVKIEDLVYCYTYVDHHSCPCVDATIREPLGERSGIIEQKTKTSKAFSLSSDRNLRVQIRLRCPHNVSDSITESAPPPS